MSSKERYWANPEKYRANSRKWFKENRVKAREYSRRFRERNPEKMKLKQRKYYLANKAKVLAANKKWSANNKRKRRKYDRAKSLAYYHSHKEEMAAKLKERRLAAKTKVFEHYQIGGILCACCGEDRFKFLEIDHINGGGSKHQKEIKKSYIYIWLVKNNYPIGFQILCVGCNAIKKGRNYCPCRWGCGGINKKTISNVASEAELVLRLPSKQ